MDSLVCEFERYVMSDLSIHQSSPTSPFLPTNPPFLRFNLWAIEPSSCGAGGLGFGLWVVGWGLRFALLGAGLGALVLLPSPLVGGVFLLKISELLSPSSSSATHCSSLPALSFSIISFPPSSCGVGGCDGLGGVGDWIGCVYYPIFSLSMCGFRNGNGREDGFVPFFLSIILFLFHVRHFTFALYQHRGVMYLWVGPFF